MLEIKTHSLCVKRSFHYSNIPDLRQTTTIQGKQKHIPISLLFFSRVNSTTSCIWEGTTKSNSDVSTAF